MITVAHEALIDLIVDADGHVDPRLGGAGFNVTRAVARLGHPVAYLGRLSGDRFGQLIRANLDQHGVKIAVEAPSAAPTTLALVDLDPAGVPSYHFYLDGTSAAAVGPSEAVLPEGTTAVQAGSLCLVMEPVGTSTEHMMVNAPDSVTVMLDPNCRPTAITSRRRCGPSPAAGRFSSTSRPPRWWTPWAPATPSAAPSSPGGSATA
jgi:fructokinase